MYGSGESERILQPEHVTRRELEEMLAAGHRSVIGNNLDALLMEVRHVLQDLTESKDDKSWGLSDVVALMDRLCEGAEERQSPLNLSDCSLHEQPLTGMDLSGIQFINADLSEAVLIDCKLCQSNLEDANLQDAILDRADLSRAKLSRANLQGASLTDANLTEAMLDEAKLDEANLRNANLTRATMQGASLVGADLEGAVLYDTRLELESLGGPIKQEQKGDYLSAKYVYLSLKENFKRIGAYDSASDVYIRERKMDRNTYAPWNLLAFHGDELYQKLRGPLRSKYSIGKALLVSVVLSGVLLVAAMGNMSVYIRLPWWTDILLLLLVVVFQYALAPALLRSWAEDKDQARLSSRMNRRHGNPMFIWCVDIIQTSGQIQYIVLFYLRFTVKWVMGFFLGGIWGYGQRPRNALVICLIIIGLFALVFGFSAGITASPPRSLGISDYVLYSMGAFATIGTSGLDPVTPLVRALTALEAILGVGTFGIFMAAIGQQIGAR